MWNSRTRRGANLSPSRRLAASVTRILRRAHTHAKRCLVAAAWLLVILGVPTHPRAGTDPAREWFTLHTAHFAIHTYRNPETDQGDDDASEALARRAAAYFEEAYRQVNTLLGWKPQETVQVTITDDGDSANGFARVQPYNHIQLLAFPPHGDASLGDYDDWLRLLIFHEYAHIAHIDNATGIPEVVNTVLGKTFKPNQGLPRWLTEGLATWVESYTSGAGRNTGALFNMFARAAALTKTLPKIGELSGPPLFEPGGSAWYLYGGQTMQTIADAVGPDAIKKWSYIYGRRLIPYSINHTVKAATGKGLDHWYGKTLERLTREALAVRSRVTRQGHRMGRKLTANGEFKGPPVVSPDGQWVLYVQSDGHSAANLGRARLAPLKPGTPARLGPWQQLVKCDGGCGEFDLSADGNTLLMRSTRYYRRVNSFSEIVRFPVRVGQRGRDGKEITRGARAQYPRLSADQRKLWVVRSRWSKTWLEALDPSTGDTLYRWDPPAWARLGEPAPSHDGKTVYLSIHTSSNRDLYALDVATKRLTRLSVGRSLEVNVRMGPDGRWLLYSSDADGVFNIYARNIKTGATYKVTNVLNGALSPVLTPDGKTLLYRGWTPTGWDVYALPFAPSEADRFAVPDPKAPRPERKPPPVTLRKSSYSPLPTLLPRSWFPSWTLDSTGLAKLGLVLGGLDVTERFGTTLAVEYDIARNDVAFSLDLNVQLTWPNLGLRIGRYTWDGTMTLGDVTDEYRGEVYFAQASVGLPLPSIMTGMSFTTGFSVDFSRGLDVPDLKPTPDQGPQQIPREGVSTAWTMGFGWNDAEQPKWAVTPIRGGSGSFGVALRHPAIGSDRNFFRMTYRLQRYIQMPYHPEHVLLLKGQGGWVTGDSGRYSSFTLGGVPEQDILVDLLNEQQGNSTYLRGFEPGAFRGDAYHLVTTEYRFPILRARTGLETVPVFFRDLHGAVFADFGVAYDEPFLEDDLERIRGSIGVELRLDVELLFGFSANLRLGYARGIGADGIDHVYFMVAPPP